MRSFVLALFMFQCVTGYAHSVHYHQPPLKNQQIEHAEIEPPLEIIKEGHPTLRLKAKEVTDEDLQSSEFQAFLDDMATTMKASRGVGLAAPQVNVSKRIFVMENAWGGTPLTHVLNPVVTYYKDKGMKSSTEGCLSIPGRRFSVPRYKELHIDYFDREGNPISEDVKGFEAIIIQHEFDHLEGILISDFVEELLSMDGVPIL